MQDPPKVFVKIFPCHSIKKNVFCAICCKIHIRSWHNGGAVSGLSAYTGEDTAFQREAAQVEAERLE
jgi:hypothetical protein